MKPPRGLSEEERVAWARLAATVTPMHGRQRPALPKEMPRQLSPGPPVQRPPVRAPAKPVTAPPRSVAERGGLDSSWDRKLSRAGIAPDFTLDLHGYTLDAAYRRLNGGLQQAIAQGARLLLVITGRPRRGDAADRGERRGAIRAKLLDWIAAGPYAGDVAAIRPAHPKHGGQGALYIILRRRRTG